MSAQLEDGYTRTANELLEQLMKIKLNGTQHSIIHCIIRNTYGFQRKSHAMSLTFIAASIESHKDLVKREMDKLIENKIVRVFKEATFNDSREVGLNKNVTEWRVCSKPIIIQSTNQSTVSEIVDQQSPNQSTHTVDQSVYQERKSFKENLKEISGGKQSSQNIFGLYQKEIGNLSEIISEKLVDLEFTYSEEWVKQAIKAAVLQDIKKLSYIEGTLKKWKLLNHGEPWTLEREREKPKNKGTPPNEIEQFYLRKLKEEQENAAI